MVRSSPSPHITCSCNHIKLASYYSYKQTSHFITSLNLFDQCLKEEIQEDGTREKILLATNHSYCSSESPDFCSQNMSPRARGHMLAFCTGMTALFGLYHPIGQAWVSSRSAWQHWVSYQHESMKKKAGRKTRMVIGNKPPDSSFLHVALHAGEGWLSSSHPGKQETWTHKQRFGYCKTWTFPAMGLILHISLPASANTALLWLPARLCSTLHHCKN